MSLAKQIFVRKASGEKEPFSFEKLQNSLYKSGAPSWLIKEVIEHIKGELKGGMRTADIYRHAFSLLRKKHPLVAARYNLKKAIMELGPSGHPFERFVGELLKAQGFSVQIGKVYRGFCISHEIDVVAEKDKRRIMVECKFHNQPGLKSDVKVALYVQARFEDIDRQWHKQQEHSQKFHEVWLVTNTKLTSDAVKYSKCVKMKAVGWSYPPKESLQNLVEKSGLHPLTCLTSLSRFQKQQLLNQGLILCKDIIRNKNALKYVGANPLKISQVTKEINNLCYFK